MCNQTPYFDVARTIIEPVDRKPHKKLEKEKQLGEICSKTGHVRMIRWVMALPAK